MHQENKYKLNTKLNGGVVLYVKSYEAGNWRFQRDDLKDTTSENKNLTYIKRNTKHVLEYKNLDDATWSTTAEWRSRFFPGKRKSTMLFCQEIGFQEERNTYERTIWYGCLRWEKIWCCPIWRNNEHLRGPNGNSATFAEIAEDVKNLKLLSYSPYLLAKLQLLTDFVHIV